MTNPTQTTDQIFALLGGAPGHEQYGEGVTQLEHALQCAKFATDVTDDEETIIAALLHDIGHLIEDVDDIVVERMGDVGVIDHEGIGASFLRNRGFSAKIAELVSAHVAAKRYLVATNPTYAARLSVASAETLRYQGGAMNQDEVAAFEADPLRAEKLRMRSWDEMGKEVDMVVPPLERYRDMVLRHLQQEGNS